MSQAASMNAIMCTPNFVEDFMTALVTPDDYNGVSKIDNRLEASFKGLFERRIDESVRAVEFCYPSSLQNWGRKIVNPTRDKNDGGNDG